jgi:hypothetical protein
MTPPARVLSGFVSHEVRRHGKQPRAFVVQGRLSKRPRERLLRDILRPIPIAEPAREISDEWIVVFAKETFDGQVTTLV